MIIKRINANNPQEGLYKIEKVWHKLNAALIRNVDKSDDYRIIKYNPKEKIFIS